VKKLSEGAWNPVELPVLRLLITGGSMLAMVSTDLLIGRFKWFGSTILNSPTTYWLRGATGAGIMGFGNRWH
jgi:hypothetical protein